MVPGGGNLYGGGDCSRGNGEAGACFFVVNWHRQSARVQHYSFTHSNTQSKV